jgi:SHS family lactate transporter-like MFS transporter
MISSASAQIEATGGDHLKTTIIKNGKSTVVPDYARVQGILIGTVATYIIFLTIIGPECVPPQGIRHCHFISGFD